MKSEAITARPLGGRSSMTANNRKVGQDKELENISIHMIPSKREEGKPKTSFGHLAAG